ncbi:MAG: hypothetical protein L0Y74_07595, partial [candidate division Zixibacteria bacterium]|nr:hypothetical protein [candidate division Zixibacteria bacterium]
GEKAMRDKKHESSTVELHRLREETLEIEIKGLTPILTNKWSEKAKAMMPGHPLGDKKVKTRMGIRNPKEEADARIYTLKGKPAMPAIAFKAAIVAACRFFEKPSMVETKLLIFVEGQGPDNLIPIKCKKVLKEMIARNSNGSAVLRYLWELQDWSAKLKVRFLPTSISTDSVVSLIDAAGRCGVGDWRPSAPRSFTGTFGTWRVLTNK